MCGDAGLSAHDDAGAPPQGDGRAVSLAGERRGEGRAAQGQAVMPKMTNLRGRLDIDVPDDPAPQLRPRAAKFTGPSVPKLVTNYTSVLTS